MDFDGIERRRAVCIDAASRIIAENLSQFVRTGSDPTRNKLETAKAVRDLATLIYVDVNKISD